MLSSTKFTLNADADRIYEGLRIPPLLDSVNTVNFVLTQEPGKLKPKDLKIAIERNRAERELRAEEQKKIREEGGGAGILDLRGILAEEKLNTVEGDAFKRQLREMAFLADVDDVEKQEIEKGFRISEEFLGSHFLSEDDIAIVYKQRARALLHKKRSDWRVIQGRQHTGLYNSNHPTIKAGAAATTSFQVLRELHPLFDVNRNDIWAKRMNTLRAFISVVSKYINRKRVTERMKKVLDNFHANNAFTREEVLDFINRENIESKKAANASKGSGSGKNEKSVDFAMTEGGATPGATSTVAAPEQKPDPNKRPVSVAAMIFSTPNEVLLNREREEGILAAAAEQANKNPHSEVTSEMARRILFPKVVQASGGKGSMREIEPVSVSELLSFNDKTFFSLKVRPEYVTLGYKPHAIPTTPLYFPPCLEKSLRTGAPEELALRPAADQDVKKEELLSKPVADAVPEPPAFLELLKTSGAVDGVAPPAAVEEGAIPLWMQSDPVWAAKDVNFFNPRPEYRVFAAYPRRCEMDSDWILRPDSEVLEYSRDPSIRSALCERAGFLSTNIYLLGSQESRNRDDPPPPGPTLTDYFNPDTDRHLSGLNCYARDHLRGPLEKDPDIAPLQTRQDKADYLTDSESDNEDGYTNFKPTMERVRKILHPPPKKVEPVVVDPKAKGGKAAPAPAAKPAAAAAPVTPAPTTLDTNDHEGFSLLGADQKKEEQVELLRDRKTLDLESTWWSTRKKQFDKIAKRMVEISQSSQCLVQALPVQMPFHSYEDEVYKLMSERYPELSSSHVEIDPHASIESLGSATLSPMKGTSTLSPVKH